jgi:Laminin G domain
MKLYDIDFDQPSEFSVSFWYYGDCLLQTKNCYIVDGAIAYRIDMNTNNVRSTVSSTDITGIISNNNQWIQVTIEVWPNNYRLLVSNRIDQFLVSSTVNPFSMTWPPSVTSIYVGPVDPILNQVPVSFRFKNFMFLKYKLSMNEHLMIPHS